MQKAKVSPTTTTTTTQQQQQLPSGAPNFQRSQSLLFKEVMQKRESRGMVRKIKNFLNTYKNQAPTSDQGSQMIQNFLNEMSADFRRNDHYKRASKIDQEGMEEALEKYITYQLYEQCFGKICEEEAERDDCVRRRLDALQDTQPHHFDIDGQFLASTQLRNLILLAQKELGKVAAYRAPREKLQCVMNCCHVINKVLEEGSRKGETIGADGFLPLLNFVVVMVNPQQLVSNVTYIRKFRGQHRIAAEESYYLTNLEAIVDWAETLRPEMITMDKSEFYDRMRKAGFRDIDQFHSGDLSQMLQGQGQGQGQGGDASGSAPLIDLNDLVSPNGVSPDKANYGMSVGDITLSEISDSTYQNNIQGGGQSDVGLVSPMPEVDDQVLIQSQQSVSSSAYSPLGPLPSIAQLESQGWRQVLDANAAGELQALHPLLEQSADNLTLEAVKELFLSYRSLAVRYEKLSAATSTLKHEVIHACSNIQEIERMGSDVLSEDAGTILARYIYFTSDLQDLTIRDIGILLVQYKDLVLRYEALCRALCQHLGIAREAQTDQTQPQTQTQKLIQSTPEVSMTQQQEQTEPQLLDDQFFNIDYKQQEDINMGSGVKQEDANNVQQENVNNEKQENVEQTDQ
eukprot:TRINITY_DN15989_c0_g1_i14.p1 TRINITY_DN15989_c0_g1~~TRINITY_DN15989_c0_g1_i14.p1  ORF type:complete len:661 (-),score=89.77 TRINITY_DN15989_c0_g1_i14:2088-3971(-)